MINYATLCICNKWKQFWMKKKTRWKIKKHLYGWRNYMKIIVKKGVFWIDNDDVIISSDSKNMQNTTFRRIVIPNLVVANVERMTLGMLLGSWLTMENESNHDFWRPVNRKPIFHLVKIDKPNTKKKKSTRPHQ